MNWVNKNWGASHRYEMRHIVRHITENTPLLSCKLTVSNFKDDVISRQEFETKRRYVIEHFQTSCPIKTWMNSFFVQICFENNERTFHNFSVIKHEVTSWCCYLRLKNTWKPLIILSVSKTIEVEKHYTTLLRCFHIQADF